MSTPIMFVSRHKIKPGKQQAFRKLNRNATEELRREKPGTLVFLPYIDEENEEVVIFHLFPGAEAMKAHMVGASKRAQRAAELLEFGVLEVYGKPSQDVIDSMRQATHQGVEFRWIPEQVNGYIRLNIPGS